MSNDDLWGDLPEPREVRTPAVILREQGEALKMRTNGLLVGILHQQPPNSPEDFLYRFVIAAPSLGQYRVEILVLIHGLGFYPATLKNTVAGVLYRCEDEGEFILAVTEILQSPNVRGIIEKLLAHLRASE